MTERFIAGVVGPPFGLKGFVKIKSLSGETAHLLILKEVLLRQGEGEKLREVEESAPISTPPSSLRMKFRGVDTPEAAQSLRGAEIIIDRAHAAPLGEGEFYVEDLKGLAVLSESGERIGEIAGVLEGGGGELVELRLPSGEVRLVPFRNEFFGDVDLPGGRVILLRRWVLE
ncbi:MAG: ribosome maturation factor RimM [Treponema sp.]|nr:ribosome maturation factor RimM [Treponema sp.]